MKKLLSIILSIVMIMTAVSAAFPAFADDMTGETVIIYTSNLRGKADWLPKLKAAKADYESKGATVYLVDTGNFLQGSSLSAYDRGNTYFELLAKAGYDALALGEYDFTFGNAQMGAKAHGTFQQFKTLTQLADDNKVMLLSSNAVGSNDSFDFTNSNYMTNSALMEKGGKKICFVAVTNPHATELCPDNLEGVTFTSGSEMADMVNLCITQSEAECTICIANAPSISGIRLGKGFAASNPNADADATVNAFSISEDNETYTFLPLNIDSYTPDAELQTLVDNAKAAVGDTDFVTVEKTVSGKQSVVRSEEAPIGNLFCDALKWYADSGKVLDYYDPDEIENGNNSINVPAENIVALFNGGNLRDSLYAGQATIKDLQRVLPYPNKVAVAYVTGEQLLEALEATMQLPAAFAQVAGIKYTVLDYVEFKSGEQYEGSQYYKSASNKIVINSVNGKKFSKTATYAVITSNFIANGGDTYCVFKNKTDLSTVTTRNVTDAVWDYIKEKLDGTVPADYAKTQGRIVHKAQPDSIKNAKITGISNKVYTGKAITLPIKVTFDGEVLENGIDYKIVYKANKNVGTATVTIVGTGFYKDSVNKTFKINPKGTALKKLTAGKKQFTAKWNKKTTQTTGYQLQYCTKKSFKGAKTVTIKKNKTTKKVVKKLAGKKKYFVRIRTYKTVNGKKYYSSWSKAKAVTTKK